MKEKQNELAKLQQEADKQLTQAKELCKQAEKHSKEAEQHLSEIINIRQAAVQHTDDIEKMKNVTLGNLSTESDTDNKAGIQAANELKDNRKIPFIEQLRAKAIVLHNAANSQHNTSAYERALTAWKSVLLENEDDAQAHFGAAYCQHMLADLSEGTQKAQYLAEAVKHYSKSLSINPNDYISSSNCGVALSSEAIFFANTDCLNNAQKKWRQADKYFQQALDIKHDYYGAISNWAAATSGEARALADNNRLHDALEKWRQADERFQQASAIKNDDQETAYNWGVSSAAEARALAGAGYIKEAKQKRMQAINHYLLALTLNHSDYQTLSNLGIVLSEEATVLVSENHLDEAEQKWEQAGECYQKALNIKPDFSAAALNWSVSLLNEIQALTQTGRKQEAHNKQQQDFDLLYNFTQKHPEHASYLSYNLACVHALNNQTEQAIQALETTRQGGRLPDKVHIETDKDLDPIRNSEAFQAWFQQAFPENTPN